MLNKVPPPRKKKISLSETNGDGCWESLWHYVWRFHFPLCFANALPLLQIMSMDIALAPPPSNARPGSLASRWVLRGHGLPAEALADHPSARPSLLLAWRSLCLCPTLKVCACLTVPTLNLSNLPLLLTSACLARNPGVSGLRPDAWLTHGKPMLMQVGSKQTKQKDYMAKPPQQLSAAVKQRPPGGWEVPDSSLAGLNQRPGIKGWTQADRFLQLTFGIFLGVRKLMGYSLLG